MLYKWVKEEMRAERLPRENNERGSTRVETTFKPDERNIELLLIIVKKNVCWIILFQILNK